MSHHQWDPVWWLKAVHWLMRLAGWMSTKTHSSIRGIQMCLGSETVPICPQPKLVLLSVSKHSCWIQFIQFYLLLTVCSVPCLRGTILYCTTISLHKTIKAYTTPCKASSLEALLNSSWFYHYFILVFVFDCTITFDKEMFSLYANTLWKNLFARVIQISCVTYVSPAISWQHGIIVYNTGL